MNIQLEFLFFALFVITLNIPFGYWRGSIVNKSLQWFLSVHLPIPLIIILRFVLEIKFSLISVIVSLICFLLGQVLGIKINSILKSKGFNVTSCLIIDLKNFLVRK
jgi:hypothetical protein